MNGRFLYWMGAFAVLFGAGAESYGCGGYPDPNMTLSIPTEVIGPDRIWYARTGQQFYLYGSACYSNPKPSYDTDVPWPLYTRLPDWACGIKKWEWDFGDGSPDRVEDYTDPPAEDGYMDGSTTHCYGYPTLYDIRLRVTDDDGYEYLWPDKSSLWPKICRVLAVDVDISINGTNKGFVSVNDDDDDDDTVADYDDGYNKDGTGGNDDDACEGEDNLVPVNVSFEPNSWPHGKVEVFAFGDYKSSIRVWDHPNKLAEPNLVLPNGISYLREYAPPCNVPAVLYVEGLATTPPGGVLLGIHYHNKSGAEIAADAVSLTVIQVELFTDEDFTNTLDDWPKEKNPDKIRSPKYMFGENDPIYARVGQLGTDPFEAEHYPSFVKVTSESDTTGVYLTVRETGPNTQIFVNMEEEGELLYLAESSSDGSKAKIKVIDEEVLTFWLRIQPGSDNYVSCKSVMVDRGEVGVEWQSAYGTYDTYPTLNTSDECAGGFYTNLGTTSQLWFPNFNNGDLFSKEDHWDSAGDSSYADSVDFAFWCGHGTTESETPRALRFFVDLVEGQRQAPDKLEWTEVDWGDTDLDWVVLNTCRFLKGNDTELKQMASGVHLICGYTTDMTIYAVAGEYFADRLVTMNIKDAWHKQCWKYQPSNNTSRVFGATACMYDFIGSTGPILTSRDPGSSSAYTHDDYTKN